jgi:hypothetical protein
MHLQIAMLPVTVDFITLGFLGWMRLEILMNVHARPEVMFRRK